MKAKWKQQICALITVSTMLSSVTVEAFAKGTRIKQSAPEEVYVDIIGEGERTTLFNENWKFHRGEVNSAQDTNFNDSSWDILNLPHDYSIDQDFTTEGEAESGFLLGGIGWYRKVFVVPEKYQDKQLMIEFDGAYMNAEVYLNGTKLGEHPYGYTAFAFDITEGLVCDGKTENVIAVKTNNKIPSSRWYSGSGIYRDVKLTVTDKVHIAYNGTQIIADDLENTKNGTVNVNMTSTVQNDSDKTRKVTVKNTLLDEVGEVASSPVTNEIEIEANNTKEIKQNVMVESPKLWSVKKANMYTMKTEIIDGNKIIDTYETKYGFRYFNFDKNNGFSLNGENMKLKGVCMHHDQGALGAVASHDAIERQVKILKDMGCNAIRVTHNPAASVLLEVCDENGMLVINEAFDGWTEYKNGNVNDYSVHFEKEITSENQIINGKVGMTWGEFDVKAMVGGARHNPSVIMWSLGNEIDEGIPGGTTPQHYVTLVDKIIEWVKDVDTTRPVTNGDNRKTTDSSTLINQINQKIYESGGVIGLNYADDTQTKAVHNTFGDWPIYGSETASAVHSRGVYNITGKDETNLQMSEYDNNEAKVGWGHSASEAWEIVIKNDFNAGEFAWTGFDYIGEPTPWNGTAAGSVNGQGAKPKSSFFGIVDTAGFEKDTYYLYKSLWDESSTTLHLMSTWNDNEIVKDSNNKVRVDVFTNAAKIELYLNGNKISEDTATEHTTGLGYKYQTYANGKLYPSFNISWQKGMLSAKAYDQEGNLIEDTQGRSQVTTNTSPTQLDAYANKTEIKADGSSLSYITVDVKDENNNVVAGADNRIQFNIEGNGKIVGVDNGNASDTDSYKANSRKAFSGKALVIVQSTKEAGDFTLTASSEGMKSSSVTVKTVKNNIEGNSYLQSYTISKNLYVGVGEKPALPTQVVGTYNNGDTKNLNVTWEAYDQTLLNKVGKFAVNGQLQDNDVAVTLTVHVIGKIVAMENYSTVTSLGVMPTLPKTVRGIYDNGAYSESFPVEWNISQEDIESEGLITVKGTASILNETKEVTITIRVTAELAESQNIASKDYSDKPVFTNGKMENGLPGNPSTTAISDSLAKLNDGIKNDSETLDARWTNWALKDLDPPVDTYVQLEWQNEYTMQNVKLWHFTDSQASVLPGDENVRFEYWNSQEDVWKEIESSHITQISYLEGDTPYGFINPITTNKLRVWMKAPAVGKCIGLTEIEVYDYIKAVQANTTTNLDELKLGGIAIDKFAGYQGYDEATKTYTVDLRKNNGSKQSITIPVVSASAYNNEAINIIPLYNNEVKIIVKSEDGQATETYTVKFIVPANKNELDKYLKGNEIVTAIKSADQYTDESYQKFKDIYDQAIVILNNDMATQQQVDEIYSQLQIAYNNLVKLPESTVNKNTLAAIIEKAEKVKETDFDGIASAIVKEFKDALNEAKNIYNNQNATQELVDASVTRLTKAMEALKDIQIDKTALQKLIDQTKSLNKQDYTTDSWNALQKALTHAKAVLDNKEATASQILEAEEMLRTAFDKLKKVGDGLTEKPSDNVQTSDTTNFFVITSFIVSMTGIAYLIKKRKEI